MRPGVRRAVASAFPMWVACISGRNSEKGGLPWSSVSCQVPVLILETSRTLSENPRFDFRTRTFGQGLGRYEVPRECSLGANRRCSGQVLARTAGKLVKGGLCLTWLCLLVLLYPSLIRLLDTVFQKEPLPARRSLVAVR